MHFPHLLSVSLLALSSTLTAQMSGTYLINPLLPLGAQTFPTFADATAALASQGIGGPVEFLVYDDGGDYTESNPFVTSNGQFGVTSDAVLTMTQWTGASASNRVTFRAAPGERPVLDATGRSIGVFWGGADYVTLEGLEICNAGFDGISLYSEASHGTALDPIIDRCRIHHCNGTAVTVYGNSSQPANTLIQNCTMWSCQQTGGGAFGTTGRFGYICSRRSNGTRIVHNTFFVDTLFNNSSYCVIGARPSSVNEAPFAEISNNIIFKLVSSSAPIFRFHAATGSNVPLPPICDSNCFFDASQGTFALHGDGAAQTAATFGDWQLLGVDTNSFDQDPLFRDAANADFHLMLNSPCRDTSTVATGVTHDFEGQPRAAMNDIGADETSLADYVRIGQGCAGTGGVAPELDLWSWPFLGNQEFTVGFENAQPNAIVGLFGSLGVNAGGAPIGAGCSAFLDPSSFVALSASTTSAAGSTSIVLPLPANPAFIAFNIGYQGLVLDAGAPLGFTVTNGIDTIFDF